MTDRISALLSFLTEHRHHVYRHEVSWNLAEQYSNQNLAPVLRAADALCKMLAAETPCLLPGERLAFTRTVKNIPELYTQEEWKKMRSEHSFAEKGNVFNICCDFMTTIHVGLDVRRQEAEAGLTSADDQGKVFLQAVIREIDSVIDLAERYRQEALKQGHVETAALLARVPRQGATSFAEALQFFRILHYTLWCEGEYHNGAGRFDQNFIGYLQQDLASGRETPESAQEWVEEFFLSFHRDSDLYIGVQQGDNGQSMMLGGCDKDGNPCHNILTEMALKASRDLKIIDPKINLRISGKTPFSLLELGSELTAAGLGFPQYSNDDVVIPALEKWGYSTEDARNYVVAACWEFTIPGCGMDVPNIDAVCLPKVLLDLLHTDKTWDTFQALLDDYAACLRKIACAIEQKFRNFTILPGPFASLLSEGRIQRARDFSEGGKYNNLGVHGTGIATAVDSLSAIKHLIFDTKTCSWERLRAALDSNFAQEPELLALCRNQAPKLGFSQEMPKSIAKQVLTAWGTAWEGLRTSRGGVWRPGTGSAMYYLRHAENLGATPDGRLAHQPFSANYAPSLDLAVPGPISVIRDFSIPELGGVCNGGPLTIELHDSLFREADGVHKTAELIYLFQKCGGHQLQLNSINRDILLDAQKHPENHRGLIVRVWGWSGYFIELDKEFQDHVIRRAEMTC